MSYVIYYFKEVIMDINTLAKNLSSLEENGEKLSLSVQPIPGEVEVLQVLIEGREELPIYLSISGDEILCISYLFKEDDVKEGSKDEMHLTMLSMNVPMPLSSFGKMEDNYMVFGALSVNATTDEILYELEMLSDNTLEAIGAIKVYLK